MVRDGPTADEQLGGDLGIGQPAPYAVEHLKLPAGQQPPFPRSWLGRHSQSAQERGRRRRLTDRAEPRQLVERPTGLDDRQRGVGVGDDLGQVQPGARGRERQLQSLEIANGGTELVLSHLGVSDRRGDQTVGAMDQRGGLRVLIRRGPMQIRRGRHRHRDISVRQAGVDQAGGHDRELRLMARQGGQPGLQHGDRSVGMALRSQHLGRDHDGTRQVSDLGQQGRRRLHRAPAQPKLGQPGERFNPRLAAAVGRHRESLIELDLRSIPLTQRDQESAVVRPTPRQQEGTSVLLGEPVGSAAPLRGPSLITSQAAGGEHAAAGPDHYVESLAFAPEGAGHRLVEEVQPVGYLALDDQRQPEIGERHQFQVTIAEPGGRSPGPR